MRLVDCVAAQMSMVSLCGGWIQSQGSLRTCSICSERYDPKFTKCFGVTLPVIAHGYNLPQIRVIIRGLFSKSICVKSDLPSVTVSSSMPEVYVRST